MRAYPHAPPFLIFWVIDCHSGCPVVFLEFQSVVEEIFEVQVLPGIRAPVVEGPFATEDGDGTIWTVPALNGLVCAR